MLFISLHVKAFLFSKYSLTAVLAKSATVSPPLSISFSLFLAVGVLSVLSRRESKGWSRLPCAPRAYCHVRLHSLLFKPFDFFRLSRIIMAWRSSSVDQTNRPSAGMVRFSTTQIPFFVNYSDREPSGVHTPTRFFLSASPGAFLVRVAPISRFVGSR